MTDIKSPDLRGIVVWAQGHGLMVVAKSDGRVIFRDPVQPGHDIITHSGHLKKVDFQSLKKLRRRLDHLIHTPPPRQVRA